MGKHYVPQFYLRGFACAADARLIWMYDKAEQQWSQAAIKQVAQERDYFSPEDEARLAREIETPANAVLERLRRQEPVSRNERATFALYIAVMIMRVPRKRRAGHDLVPGVLANTVSEAKEVFGQLLADQPDRAEATMAELTRLHDKFLRDPPQSVIDQIRSPWPSVEMVEAVAQMTWRIIRCPPGTHFLTTDNPAYFFDSYGVGTPLAEVTFPLSSDLAFAGSHQGEPASILFVSAKPQLRNEVNRRMASGAERFVFFHRRADWVATLADRQNPYLSRIAW